MKKWTASLLVVITSLFFGITCSAQEVPQTVKDAFAKKFPNVSEVMWERGDEGDNVFEAEFVMDGHEFGAEFSADGTWKQTEKEISEDALPKAVKQALARDYDDAEIEEVDELTTPQEILYEVAIESEDENEEGEEEKETEDESDEEEDEDETLELIFREDGTLVKKLSSDSDDDDQ